MAFVDPDNPLAAEILQEAGEAYFTACKSMVRSLAALADFDAKNPTSVGICEAGHRRTELLIEAAEKVHFVLIQREALRLSGTESFFENYGIPVEVRQRLGRTRPT